MDRLNLVKLVSLIKFLSFLHWGTSNVLETQKCSSEYADINILYVPARSHDELLRSDEWNRTHRILNHSYIFVGFTMKRKHELPK